MRFPAKSTQKNGETEKFEDRKNAESEDGETTGFGREFLPAMVLPHSAPTA
jgi:hypothetical protein